MDPQDLPGVATPWVLPGQVRTLDLLSDVHLHPCMPQTAARWAAHLRHTEADAVVMLGDLFETWVGDDLLDDPAGDFWREAFDTMRQAASQRLIAFMPGNRDFLLGPAAAARVPLTLLPDPTLLLAFGQRWLLSHGDALCLQDLDYQHARRLLRSPDWQAGFLRQPLAARRHQADAMRQASMAHQAGRVESIGDVDPAAAQAAIRAAGARALVHGHTHRPAHHAAGTAAERWVLSDWDFDVDDPHAARGDVLRLDPQGWRRLKPVA